MKRVMANGFTVRTRLRIIVYSMRTYDSNDWMEGAVYEETLTYTP